MDILTGSNFRETLLLVNVSGIMVGEFGQDLDSRQVETTSCEAVRWRAYVKAHVLLHVLVPSNQTTNVDPLRWKP